MSKESKPLKNFKCPLCSSVLTFKIDSDKKTHWICSNTDCKANNVESELDPVQKAENENQIIEKKKLIDIDTFDKIDDSMVRKWQENMKIKDNLKHKWKKIADEVYYRKTLTFSAASDLQKKGVRNPLPLAVTDVFVEKAQRILTLRGRIYYWSGIGTSLLAIGTLIFAGYFIFTFNLADYIKDFLRYSMDKETVNSFIYLINLRELKLDGSILSMMIIKATSAGALFLAAVYFLVSLSRALFHEATVLFNRRHALRFGRLYVYLKNGDVDLNELELAFKWNDEFTTAFKDIQADKITKTPWTKALEIPRDLSHEFLEYLGKKRENKKGKK